MHSVVPDSWLELVTAAACKSSRLVSCANLGMAAVAAAAVGAQLGSAAVPGAAGSMSACLAPTGPALNGPDYHSLACCHSYALAEQERASTGCSCWLVDWK